MHRLRSSCRACDGGSLERFLELGPQPLANRFLRDLDRSVDEPRFPLDLYRCLDCHLVQLLDVIDAETLFRDYVYVTGTSETMAAHFASYANDVVDALELGPDDLVAEVASNDGLLLQAVQKRGVRALGVEPARNIAAMANERGVPTIPEFFGPELARELHAEHGPASAIIANNVLAHVDDTVAFLAAAASWVAPAGRVVTEFPYLVPMLDGLEYDTVYHEHLCYFSVLPLLPLFERAGLSILRIDDVPVHGGSLRVWSASRDSYPKHADSVRERARGERALGLAGPERYQEFARAVSRQRDALRALLRELLDEGRVIAAYGAPAKGNTMLNYCGLDTGWIRYVVDRNPLKVDKWTPGTHIPVRDVAYLDENPPDDLLILPWNLADEIMRQQEDFARGGGRFILPLPEPRIVKR